MVSIPYSESDWSQIETEYRRLNPEDKRKKLPVRHVAAWWAGYSIRNGTGLPIGSGEMIC